MPNQISTFAEFLARIKSDGQLNDTSQDTNILNWTNEALVEAIGITDHLRDFALDTLYPIASIDSITVLDYWANIEQVYYQRVNGSGVLIQRYAITEQGGMICPAPMDLFDFPSCYTFKNNTTSNVPNFLMTFYPVSSARLVDKIQIIGSGFKHITDTTTIMPYVSVYPFLIRSVLQRMQINRNKEAEDINLMNPLIQRSLQSIAKATREKGNSENDTRGT